MIIGFDSKKILTDIINKFSLGVKSIANSVLLTIFLLGTPLLISTLPIIADNEVVNSPSPLIIEWSNKIKNLSSYEFGLNQFDMSVSTVSNPRYQENMAYMAPGIIRVHYAGLFSSNSQNNKRWTTDTGLDRERISQWATHMKLLRSQFDYKLMINIPGFPAFIDGFENPDEFADFNAELIAIIQDENDLKIDYLEITNEWDNDYPMDDILRVYNTVAKKIKAIDPSIKTGGIGFERADRINVIKSFIDGSLPESTLDFVSYHAYAGNSTQSNQNYFYNKSKLTSYTTALNIRNYLIEKNAPNIEVFHGESNLCYTWNCGDRGMQGQTVAVYDALGYIHILEAGGNGVQTWNEKDGSYGKMSDGLNLRPAAHVLQMLNKDRPKNIVRSTINNDDIKQFSFVSESGKLGLFVVNRSPTGISLPILSNQELSLITQETVNDGVYSTISGNINEVINQITLPSESVNKFVFSLVPASTLQPTPNSEVNNPAPTQNPIPPSPQTPLVAIPQPTTNNPNNANGTNNSNQTNNAVNPNVTTINRTNPTNSPTNNQTNTNNSPSISEVNPDRSNAIGSNSANNNGSGNNQENPNSSNNSESSDALPNPETKETKSNNADNNVAEEKTRSNNLFAWWWIIILIILLIAGLIWYLAKRNNLEK